MPSNARCACPGDVLTFTCSVVGLGNTVTLWNGTAFDCPSTFNEIILRHSQFAARTSGGCNGGTITVESRGVENNNYISVLNVAVNTGLNNRTVQCQHITINSTIIVGIQSLIVTSGSFITAKEKC